MSGDNRTTILGLPPGVADALMRRIILMGVDTSIELRNGWGDVHNLPFAPLRVMRRNDHGAEPRVKHGDRAGWRSMQPVEGKSVTPDGCPAFNDDQRSAGYLGQ